MAVGLLTQEMIDKVRQQQQDDAEFRARLKDLTFSLILASTDAPGNEDRQCEVHIKNGVFTHLTSIRKTAPSDEIRSMNFDKESFDAKVLSDHQMLYDFICGKMDAPEIIQKVKIEGDFGKFVTQLDGFMRFIAYLPSLDVVP